MHEIRFPHRQEMSDLIETGAILEVAVPVLIVASGIMAGPFLEKVILRWLDVLAERTKWHVDNIVFKSIRGVPVFWGAAAGIYLATLTLDITERPADILGKVLLVAVLWSLTIIAARVVASLTSTYAGREASFIPVTSLIPALMRLAVYVIGLLIILSSLEISIAPLLTALGVGGLAVALALQNTLSNVFAGLYLIASAQIKPGNYLRLDNRSHPPPRRAAGLLSYLRGLQSRPHRPHGRTRLFRSIPVDA